MEDISLQTYIRAQLLKALETGDTSDLPQPIFVQGFIRRYADALGLDGTNFSKQFPVHSIPDTPRPVPRPAAQVDMSYQTVAPKPPVQAKPNQPMPNQAIADRAKSNLGAVPSKSETDPAPVLKNVGLPEKVAAEKESFEKPSSEQSVPSATEDLTLDPNPVSDSELTALGLNNLGTSADAQTISPERSSPLPHTETTAAILTDEDSSPVGVVPPETSAPIGYSLSNGSSSGTSWLPLGIGAAVLVGAIAFIGPRLIGGSSDQPETTAETVIPEPEPEVVQAAPVEVAPEPEPQPEPVSSAPVSVQVEITEAGPSWMSINVDGEVVFEGLLDPGTQQAWEGQKSITLNVGNAVAALISAIGSEPTPAGNPGGAEFLPFTAQE